MAKKAVKKETVAAPVQKKEAVAAPAVKKETVAAPAAKKETAAAPAAKKAPAVKSETKVEVFLQFADREIRVDDVLKAAEEDFRSNDQAALESVQLYLKPEDCAAYYVANGDHSGKVAL
jgi:hypothetical protein